jgi:hypothetical protein
MAEPAAGGNCRGEPPLDGAAARITRPPEAIAVESHPSYTIAKEGGRPRTAICFMGNDMPW